MGFLTTGNTFSSGHEVTSTKLNNIANAATWTDDATVTGTKKLQFRDTGMYIHSTLDGQLDVVSDTTLTVTAPTTIITANTALTLASTTAININGVTTVNDDGSNGDCVTIDNDGTGLGLNITQDATLAVAKYALRVYSNEAQTNADLVRFENDNESTDQPVLLVIQNNESSSGRGIHARSDGTGEAIFVDANSTGAAARIDAGGNGAHILFTGDPTVASPADGEMWFDGTNLKFRIGSTTYNIDMTSA
jgi:hypothetical protein